VRNFETVHAECTGKTPEFFHRQLNEFNKKKQVFAKTTTVTSKPFHVPFKFVYKLEKRKKKKEKKKKEKKNLMRVKQISWYICCY
jgi:hypothetical protein